MSDDQQDAPLEWTPQGLPKSRLYGDVYFSLDDGLAECRTVFLLGNGLPERWRGRRSFTVAELGFGSGLNIAALLALWNETRSPGAHLSIFSVEAHPLAAADAARALASWPEIAPYAQALTRRWPCRARGAHRLDLPEFAATLDVAIMEAGDALRTWDGRADAWFLDGFSPALNPAMWRDEVLALVARRSAPGARAATFTVAGQVRRALASAGFAVAKRPGHGRKRERLEAVLPGEASEPPSRRVAIVGAGIAGAAAARAVRRLGGEALLIESASPGAGASGNPAALVTPRLDAGLDGPARLFAQAFRRAVQLYAETPGCVVGRGVLQLATQQRDAARFAKIVASDLFAPSELALLSAEETAARLAEAAPGALDQRTALVIAPGAALSAWGGEVAAAEVASVERTRQGWSLHDPDGVLLARADAVIVAAGLSSCRLGDAPAMTPVRGQLSWAPGLSAPSPGVAWGGYALNGPHGVVFGATHDREEIGTDVREADHQRNLATLARGLPGLAALAGAQMLEGRASIRAATRDRLPFAGDRGDGLLLLTGFGSRGFSFAPLLAEHVAALALGAPSPLPTDLAELVAPQRRSA